METHIVDEKTGISYTLHGDYYLPDLTLPEDKTERRIGIWSIRHKRYLLEHKKSVVLEMQLNGTLMDYLADINEAEEMFLRVVKQFAENEGITEQLKADDQMLWVQKMNNVRERAMEIVNKELIYV